MILHIKTRQKVEKRDILIFEYVFFYSKFRNYISIQLFQLIYNHRIKPISIMNKKQKLKKDGDDRLNAIVKENNQLKSELSRVNLELEKLESRFSMQVDEYEIEIENITNKLKEKENTVKVSKHNITYILRV